MDFLIAHALMILCHSLFKVVIDDIAEGSKLIVLLVTVHPIIDCDKVNIMLREENLRVHPNLQVITAEAGHIFYNDPLDLPGLHISDHALETGPVKRLP